jgi:hypothetical protein
MWGLSCRTFWKQSPIQTFWKRRRTHATVPLNNDPIRQGFYQAILKKKLGLRTYTASDRKLENVDTSRPRPKASHLGRTPSGKKWFCHWGDMAVVLQSFFTTLERNRWWRRNNNCAVARTRTVKVLKWLIGDATKGAGRKPQINGRCDVIRAW